MAEKGRIIHGARARLLIEGKKVGYCTGVSLREEIAYEPAKFIDSIETTEFIPDDYNVSGTLGFVRVFGETLKKAGLFPKTGKTAEEHLRNILMQKDLVMVIEDNKEEKALETVTGMKLASNNLQINARGIAGKDVEFIAIRSQDESET